MRCGAAAAGGFRTGRVLEPGDLRARYSILLAEGGQTSRSVSGQDGKRFIAKAQDEQVPAATTSSSTPEEFGAAIRANSLLGFASILFVVTEETADACEATGLQLLEDHCDAAVKILEWHGFETRNPCKWLQVGDFRSVAVQAKFRAFSCLQYKATPVSAERTLTSVSNTRKQSKPQPAFGHSDEANTFYSEDAYPLLEISAAVGANLVRYLQRLQDVSVLSIIIGST